MKRSYLLVIILGILFYSCTDESGLELTLLDNNQCKDVQVSKKRPLIYDKIYEIRDGKEIDLTHTQFLSTRSTHEFYDITTIDPKYTYLGSVITRKSIDKGRYVPVGYPNIWKNPITISFSLPVKSKTIAPKLSSLQDAIAEVTSDKNFTGKQSQLFSYKMKEFSYYKELKLAFSANVDITKYFNVNTQVNSGRIIKKTAMFIDFSQIYFNVAMDMPDDGNVFINEETRSKFLSKEPIYINSVNYGRKGIILVESDYTYDELSIAIRAAFNAKIVNGQLSLDDNKKEILSHAQIQICIIGGDGEGAVKTIEGFNAFQEYIIKGGVYSKEVYGVPITFSGAYASDNSMFISEFDL